MGFIYTVAVVRTFSIVSSIYVLNTPSATRQLKPGIAIVELQTVCAHLLDLEKDLLWSLAAPGFDSYHAGGNGERDTCKEPHRAEQVCIRNAPRPEVKPQCICVMGTFKGLVTLLLVAIVCTPHCCHMPQHLY